MAQRINYSNKTQRRIEKIEKMLNGTLEPPPFSCDNKMAGQVKNESMQQKIKIFFS